MSLVALTLSYKSSPLRSSVNDKDIVFIASQKWSSETESSYRITGSAKSSLIDPRFKVASRFGVTSKLP